MNDFNQLSESELREIINNAEKALKEKQSNKRKETINKIKELAASIGITVEIHDTEKKLDKRSSTVAARYRNPEDASQTWTGRGLKPKWIQVLLDAGKSLSDFEI